MMDGGKGTGCPHHSVAWLNRYTRRCDFPKADITILAKRLLEGSAPPPAEAGDPVGLKVEKNALALVFIPAVISLAEDFAAAHPGAGYERGPDGLIMTPLAERRPGPAARNPQGEVCARAYGSLHALFRHLAEGYVRELDAAARGGDAQMAWVAERLLAPYARALRDYNQHTPHAATHFTPAGHIMAGVNTALFFILRALSAVMVLGEARLGRPVGRDDLAAAMRNTLPLLLTIARCHLEQLLELEGPLGKQEDLFMTGLDAAAYGDRLAAMFELAEGADGLRLEIRPEVLDTLPLLSGAKPRTGCPALYASTFDNVNAIVALARMTERTFADLCLPA